MDRMSCANRRDYPIVFAFRLITRNAFSYSNLSLLSSDSGAATIKAFAPAIGIYGKSHENITWSIPSLFTQYSRLSISYNPLGGT